MTEQINQKKASQNEGYALVCAIGNEVSVFAPGKGVITMESLKHEELLSDFMKMVNEKIGEGWKTLGSPTQNYSDQFGLVVIQALER